MCHLGVQLKGMYVNVIEGIHYSDNGFGDPDPGHTQISSGSGTENINKCGRTLLLFHDL
jgi:hypothetical protein